jgi:hypothetical protein
VPNVVTDARHADRPSVPVRFSGNSLVNVRQAIANQSPVAYTIVGVEGGHKLLSAATALGLASACARNVIESVLRVPQLDVSYGRFLGAFGRGGVAGQVIAVAQTAVVDP